MTDPPKRHSTITPPPDRARRTDPPLPTDPAPPESLLLLAENVLPRLIATEVAVTEMNGRLSKLDEIHALLMGAAPEQPGGRARPSIVSELHQMNNHASAIGVNTELVAEAVDQVAAQQKTLPELIAEAVANKVVSLYQSEIRALREADAALLVRVEQIAEVAGVTGVNGNGPHK
jgi:hypothetical protein